MHTHSRAVNALASTRRLLVWPALAAGVMLAVGCGANSPTAPLTPPARSLVPAGLALATLEISGFAVKPAGLSSGRYWYVPSLRLTETGGRNAATLLSMTFALPGGNSFGFSGPGCFLGSNVVNTGHTWDLGAVSSYCLDIDAAESLSGRDMDVTVAFTDEEGRPGTAKARTKIQ